MSTVVAIVVGLVCGAAVVAFAGTAARRRARDDRAEAERLRQENTALQVARSTAETRLDDERRSAEEKLDTLRQSEQQLKQAFAALAADALSRNNQQFLELARTHLEKAQQAAQGDLQARQRAIDELVKPLGESLTQVNARIADLEKARSEAYGSLREQLTQVVDAQRALRDETGRLVTALRAPQVRGRWGEIQLQRVVELAGMLEYCDFVTQATVSGEGGRLRPDLIVRLPAGKHIVVDAKAPLDAYLRSLEAADDNARATLLKEHARQVRDHLGKLGQKQYWEQFEASPEFVVLFLPGEIFYSAALQADPALIEAGVHEQVLLATPTTLIALLKAVAYGWRQERLAENAQKISELGRDLYERTRVFAEHFGDVGDRLAGATKAYNRAASSLETRLLVGARRFRELGAGSDKEIAPSEPVEEQPRALAAAELGGGDD